MGFKVEVLGRDGQPKANVSVRVLYDPSGQDNGYTDGEGIFDTGGSGGKLRQIDVSGSKAKTTGRTVGYDDTITVNLTY